mmetsp:Transcript_9824/g.25442  ORF Transcript_9824/g.25442 Transcript_9824/m.25442 type:complete len:242 (-) Transcript_9824:197-922(-)
MPARRSAVPRPGCLFKSGHERQTRSRQSEAEASRPAKRPGLGNLASFAFAVILWDWQAATIRRQPPTMVSTCHSCRDIAETPPTLCAPTSTKAPPVAAPAALPARASAVAFCRAPARSGGDGAGRCRAGTSARAASGRAAAGSPSSSVACHRPISCLSKPLSARNLSSSACISSNLLRKCDIWCRSSSSDFGLFGAAPASLGCVGAAAAVIFASSRSKSGCLLGLILTASSKACGSASPEG